ncbi:hypothetical protein TNCT6_79250 [Streptomyces sp. 6-11-2]|nr:hypothetical protein TNCT6_79250 [Streptomyces sp. 6-11-2]
MRVPLTLDRVRQQIATTERREPAVEPDEQADAAREEQRRLRRRRKARLRAAELGRSRGGLTSKVHLSADRRCRPLSFALTPGALAWALRLGPGRLPSLWRIPPAPTTPTCADAGSGQ